MTSSFKSEKLNLTILSLGNFVNNTLLRKIAEFCPKVKELRLRGPCQEVTDLGLKYLAGSEALGSSDKSEVQHYVYLL